MTAPEQKSPEDPATMQDLQNMAQMLAQPINAQGEQLKKLTALLSEPGNQLLMLASDVSAQNKADRALIEQLQEENRMLSETIRAKASEEASA